MAQLARPKVRSRRGGAAVPLDETDKQLLNLMQGRFPIEPRPFARVAELAGLPEDEVLRARPVPARQADHPRDHADLRHARVRLRVDARRGQGRPRQPAPRGAVHQHPPRRHAQLPARPRLQPLVHDRRRARLEAGPGRDARRHAAGDRRRVDPPAADAQAVQDPHGPRDGGRDRRALDRRRGRRAAGARADRADRGGHRHGPRDAGPDARRARALRARGRAGSACRSRRCSSGSSRSSERGGLRRVAAILYHRRAGFSANGMGVWAVPEAEILETGKRMAAFRGISHCYQRPTYADWPYSVFTMAHGRSKEECDAILDSIAEATGIERARDALLEHRVQEGPDALLHRRVRALGRGARALSPTSLSRHALGGALPPGRARAARRRELAGARDARRSAATRSSSSAPPARRSSTSTATRTSTTSARGAR